jgi:hypothetical protein
MTSISSALILRSRASGVSKDAPVQSGAIWSLLRDAPAALLRMRAFGRAEVIFRMPS